MKKIITIFTCLFFNSLFSSSYDECMKIAQNVRKLNHQTQIFVREHAAQRVSASLEKDYFDFLEQEKSVLKQKKLQALAKKVGLQRIEREKAINDIKILTMKITSTFDTILKDKKSFNDSFLELEKTNVYKELLKKYPVVEKAEHKSKLYSILIKQYQSYRLSFIVKETK